MRNLDTGKIIPFFQKSKFLRSEVFIEAYAKTEEDIKENGIEAENSGSTAVTVYISSINLLCANVGDSRAIIGSNKEDNKWTSSPLSVDHKPDVKEEYERIIKANGHIDTYIGK